MNKQFLQVPGLCGTPFLSYLPKRSTEIYRAQYADVILVSFRGTPTWRPEINEKIWNSLLLWERLLFPRDKKGRLWHGVLYVTCWAQFRKFKRLYFKHKGWYRAGNLWTDIFSGVLTPGDDNNLAGLASFDFRILWRHVQTSNIRYLRSFGSYSVFEWTEHHSIHSAPDSRMNRMKGIRFTLVYSE